MDRCKGVTATMNDVPMQGTPSSSSSPSWPRSTVPGTPAPTLRGKGEPERAGVVVSTPAAVAMVVVTAGTEAVSGGGPLLGRPGPGTVSNATGGRKPNRAEALSTRGRPPVLPPAPRLPPPPPAPPPGKSPVALVITDRGCRDPGCWAVVLAKGDSPSSPPTPAPGPLTSDPRPAIAADRLPNTMDASGVRAVGGWRAVGGPTRASIWGSGSRSSTRGAPASIARCRCATRSGDTGLASNGGRGVA
jgi:hypothetical protein